MSVTKEKFRPSSRIISTIGENLIKDNYAAIVELVKNSYDADASLVTITFEYKDDKQYISIEDDGIGMSPDTIVNKWLVPATDDKLIKNVSAKGRLMQGQKGIGRFSTAILGEKLTLITKNNGIKSHFNINWNEFNSFKYLDEIVIDLETSHTNEKSGSLFRIECQDKSKFWTEENIIYLEKELRKTLTPLEKDNSDSFDIILEFKDFYIQKYNNTKISITPLPLLSYYNYRLYGQVDNKGNASMIFEYRDKNVINKEKIEEKIRINKNYNYCGNVEFDFRVFERDKNNLVNVYENEIYISDSLDSMNINEIKRLLNKICGISVYKNNFRIRPYGDEGYDWLELDKERVQDPSYKIGFNQISGIIKIESEEKSGLIEKSARDGLREDSHFSGFKEIIERLINILESKRYNLKQNEKQSSEHEKLNAIVNNENLKEKLNYVVEKTGINKYYADKIKKIIEEDSKYKQNEIERLSNNIAKYENQATLGKIIDLIIHEIRKPLMWFKTQSITISKVYDRYKKSQNINDLEKIVKIIEASQTEASLISDFFKKIDILATRDVKEKENFNLLEIINNTLDIFKQVFENKGINTTVNCNTNITFYGWKKDLIIALSNIIENSIYWISNFNTKKREIIINVERIQEKLIIVVEDTGIGFDNNLLENNLLFRPGVSTRKNGTGIGLTIVGNCISRNSGSVEAYNNKNGACIKIILPLEGDNNE